MAPSTFLDVLRTEVAKFQAVHPEREGELARAHALILHGMVRPSADDPDTGQVLSSDGAKHYTVNGQCDCQAGQRDKPCKHLQSWRLYQYIAKKVEAAQPTPVPAPLPEARCSVNVRVQIAGRDTQVTLRGQDEVEVLTRLEALLQRYPVPQPPAPATSQAPPKPMTGWCAVHDVAMTLNTKDGRSWHSHRKPEGGFCKGR